MNRAEVATRATMTMSANEGDQRHALLIPPAPIHSSPVQLILPDAMRHPMPPLHNIPPLLAQLYTVIPIYATSDLKTKMCSVSRSTPNYTLYTSSFLHPPDQPTSQVPILCVFLAYHKTSDPQPLVLSESVTTSAQATFCIVPIAHGGDGSGL